MKMKRYEREREREREMHYIYKKINMNHGVLNSTKRTYIYI